MTRRSLRTTVALAFACLVALATAVVGGLSYETAAGMVRADEESVFAGIVNDLQIQIRQGRFTPEDFTTGNPRQNVLPKLLDATRITVQVLGPQGAPVGKERPVPLPFDRLDRTLAPAERAGTGNQREVALDGSRYRTATVALGDGRGAIRIAQRLSDTETLLSQLRQYIMLLAGAVIVVAAGAGWWLARRITHRLTRLAAVTAEVASTGRLDLVVPVTGDDEIGRLGHSFHDMLGRLARAKQDQQRLVHDAGHELRTPLTSLRTNIAVLQRFGGLPPETQADLLHDLSQEARELTHLVNELVQLAAYELDDEEPVALQLAELTEHAAAVARRRTGRDILVHATPAVVTARRAALQRAISNLLDNAAKFDPDGTHPIELIADRSRIEVRDRGPGIDEDDLQRVFDRFYRAVDTRALPGSGLGLAIVNDVALRHGGTPFAANRPGGGAAVGFTLGKRR
ncbi:HAMP domain-containing sensor histidine kinase [Streptosporangium canum]|uniref:HAMP domain-containing sensor histidine kinase n=1 Tax=Streptosporangium canum TaxID=324952 RepID=UPI0033A675FA